MEPRMKFFTSDTHFGHRNILAYCHRPFESIEGHDDVLIENINRTVMPLDDLFHLGDFAFGGGKPEHFIEQINCKNIHLIMGNHDPHKHDGSPTTKLLECGFATVRSLATVVLEGDDANIKAQLCHYPIESWRSKAHGYLHLHGHTHGLLGSPDTWRMDVGVDGVLPPSASIPRPAEAYRPYSEQEIITVMTRKGII
jgi:calcineurin-like phosphoesterase family protein